CRLLLPSRSPPLINWTPPTALTPAGREPVESGLRDQAPSQRPVTLKAELSRSHSPICRDRKRQPAGTFAFPAVERLVRGQGRPANTAIGHLRTVGFHPSRDF